MEGEVDPHTQRHLQRQVSTDLMYEWGKAFGRCNMTLKSTAFFFSYGHSYLHLDT